MKSQKIDASSPELLALADTHLPKNAKITPMLKQWLVAKGKGKSAILLFRMGDFYEIFAQDAEIAAPILELALTARDKNKGDAAVPMAGFPHHSAAQYIAKLIGAGHKVAVCDQMEDPAQAKGIVKREITRVVTPGTVLEEDGLKTTENNFMVGVIQSDSGYGLSILDVSTGEFWGTVIADEQMLKDEIARLKPAEVVWGRFPSPDLDSIPATFSLKERGTNHSEYRDIPRSTPHLTSFGHLDPFFKKADKRIATLTAEMLLEYLAETQGKVPANILPLKPYSIEKNLLLDPITIQHLDLMGPKGNQKKEGTLLSILDKTRTAMGSRMLTRSLLSPSGDLGEIKKRHDLVGALIQNPHLRDDIRSSLKYMYDLERLASRVAANRITPREMGHLRNSLGQLPVIKAALSGLSREGENPFDSLLDPRISAGDRNLDTLHAALLNSLIPEPPHAQKEGGIFKKGYDPTLDELTSLARGGRDAIALIESREKERTGIPSLKIKYTRVFGYYIEVTRTHLDKVPADYKRKQTIATGERYVTEELAELESKVASAETKRILRESELFEELRQRILSSLLDIQNTAAEIAFIDMMCAFSITSEERGYCRPKLLELDARKMTVQSGRHPIVEVISEQDGHRFVPNDIELDEHSQMLLITGPNMGGKSTIMRQVALIQIMAQAGCFVPANSAEMSICDRIFTRVGASDDLASARSTFMVEMSETAHILKHATSASIVLLDEIGRGTSTFDGLSIAWSVAEFIHECVGARTLFATHYHEMTELSGTLSRLKNMHVAVSERDGDIAFLYTLIEGAAEQSYGVHVAKLAGMPDIVIDRANEVLGGLERKQKRAGLPRVGGDPSSPSPTRDLHQLDLFGRMQEHKKDERIKELEIEIKHARHRQKQMASDILSVIDQHQKIPMISGETQIHESV